jgi:hypothetical protein
MPQEPINDGAPAEQIESLAGNEIPSADSAAPEAASPASMDTGGAPSQASLLDRLTSRGYDVTNFKTDDAAFDALVAAAEAYEQAQPFVRYGQEYASHATEFQKWQQEQAAKAQQEQATQANPEPEKPSFEWNTPEFDPAWKTRCRWDAEAGRWVPATQYDSPAIADKLNAYTEWHQSAGQRIVSEFPQLVQQAIADRLTELEKSFDQRVTQSLQGAFAEYEQAQANRQYLEAQKAEFYQLDPKGQPLVNPQTGEYVLKPKGEAFRNYLVEARDQFGITDPGRMRAYAERMVAADLATGKLGQSPAKQETPAGASAPAPTPEQVAQQKKGEFLSRVVKGQRAPNRGGSTPPPTAPADAMQNPDATLDQLFQEEMERAGLKPARS